jgi:electron transport complex protein RnfA
MEYIEIIIATIFVNNILLAQFLGNCPFLGTSKKMETAMGMAMAVIFVLVMAGVMTWLIFNYLLVPNNLVFLRTIAFILVIASLVQFVEMFLKKSIPALYAGLGIFLPLITTNCAVFGVCVLNIDKELGFLPALVTSFGYAAGFGLALIIFAGAARTHPAGPGAQAPAGHLHRPDHRRCDFTEFLCLSRHGID